ncbi:MAG: type III pantothenate kinase [Ruminococcaceae bacterium]|nr:type III pantothenate kinase [Oscillospiraceae bacterium]
MLLAVDIGNSSISAGLFNVSDGELLYTFKIAADTQKTADEYFILLKSMLTMYADGKMASCAIIGSVVPRLTYPLQTAIQKLTGATPLTVGPGVKTGFPIRIADPSELGADLVANAAGVLGMHKERRAAVIVDVGTATTVSAINASGEFLGSAIMPGVGVSLDMLHSKTAQLPAVTPEIPERAIGKSSRDAVRSGVIFGNAMLIDGFIDRFEKEMRVAHSEAEIYATGGLANVILPACRHEFTYDENLTVKGLFHIYKNNSR